MTWYIEDLARFKKEREQLATLERRAEWCTIVGMRNDTQMRVIFDVDITVGDMNYEAELQFPAQFPFSPPLVYPRDKTSRWSMHQYGDGGELCPEYGPDNWTPDLTGADILESAHRLLAGENPPAGGRAAVPSRHLTSLGQKLRSSARRLVMTRNLDAFLAGMPNDAVRKGVVALAWRGPNILYTVLSLSQSDGTPWLDHSVPEDLGYESFDTPIAVLRIAPEDAAPPTDPKQFREICSQRGVTQDVRCAVILHDQKIYAYSIDNEGARKDEIKIVPAQPEKRRISEDHDSLTQKRVAIVGCGSLGSKVGTMLARSGVGNFVLIDDDILFPDNLIRNEFDWRDVGAHKANILARRIKHVNPTAKSRTRIMQLGGQESAGAAETLLTMLTECDLIIDATANHDAFNIIAAVAANKKQSVLWAQVLAGGVGGFIARSRYGKEPSPQLARRSIENWFRDQGTPLVQDGIDYGTGNEAAPMFADDADVTAIAAHAARLAIDTIINREPSMFPYSAYAIGLAEGMCFTQPFETKPILLGDSVAEEPKEELSKLDAEKEINLILGMFVKK